MGRRPAAAGARMPVAVMALLLAVSAGAQTTLYWDTGGPSTTWKAAGSNQNWNTAADGSGSSSNWVNGHLANFGAGTGPLGTLAIAVAGAPTVDSIVIDDGTLTFTGSSLALTGSTPSVAVASGAAATFNTKFVGTGDFIKTGAGSLTLNSTGNAYTGATTVSAGTLSLGGGNSILPNTTAVTVASGANIAFTAGGATQLFDSLSGAGHVDLSDNLLKIGGATSTTFSGSLSGSGILRQQGTGSLTLSGDNSTFGGSLTVNSGTVVAANSHALGTATSGNTVASGAALQLAGGISLNETDLTIRGTGTDGTGVLRSLSGSNALAAGITVAAASTVASDAGSTFTLSGDISRAGQNLTIDGAGDTILSGAVGGAAAGQLIKTGTGTLTLSGSAANPFAGAISITDGTLQLNKSAGAAATGGGAVAIGDGAGSANSATLRLLADNQLPISSGLITVAADGLLDLNNHAQTVNTIAGTGTIALGTTGALTVGGNNGSSTFAGALTGTGSFTKAGTGVLALAASLTFNGTFYLAGGTLRLSDLTLNLANLVLTGNSTIDFAGSAASLLVTNLNLNGYTLDLTHWADATDYFYAANWTGATPDLTGSAPMNQVTFNGFAASDTRWQAYDHQITPVPESAATGALLLGFLLGFAARRRRPAHAGR